MQLAGWVRPFFCLATCVMAFASGSRTPTRPCSAQGRGQSASSCTAICSTLSLLHCLRQAPPRLLLHAQRQCGGKAVFPPRAERGLWWQGRNTGALRDVIGCVQPIVAGVKLVPEAHRGNGGAQRREHGPGGCVLPRDVCSATRAWKITAAA